MEITKTVTALRTGLNHLQNTLECDMKSISGQDQETVQLIDTILSDARLQSFFQIEDEDQLRKLHLLLFLNVDLKISSQLESDGNVGHVVGAIPQLSSRLYFALAKRYNLFKYMNEILKFCAIAVIEELLEIINSEVRYLSPVDRFQVLGCTLETIGIRLIETDCELSLKKLAEHFQTLLLHFKKLMINAEESTRKTVSQISDEGYKFAHLISLFLNLTENIFSEDKICQTSPSIYEITIHFDVAVWESERKSKSDIIRKCYENMFSRCRELMEELDLDTFITWYEIPTKDSNLQTFIGEKVFHLCRLLQEKQPSNLIPGDADILISMLQCIVVKPTAANEETNSNDVSLEESILKNYSFDKYFLQRVERFLEDGSCFTPNVNIIFVHKLLNDETRSNVDLEYLKKIITLAIQRMETHDLTALLGEFITKCGLNHFMVEDNNDFIYLMKELSSLFAQDVISNEEREEEFIQLREKQILKDVALMGFRATYADIKTIFREACTDKHDVIVLIKLFQTLRTICLYKSEFKSGGPHHSVVIEILKEFLEDDYCNLTLAEKYNFNRAVISLCNHELLHVDDFLSTCLLPILHVSENSNWSLLSELMLLFKDIFVNMHRDLGLCWPILLIQVAQILDDCRWSVTTFSDERMVLCQRTIDAIIVFMEHPREVTKYVLHWMENQLKTYSPLTRSYFTSICSSNVTTSIDDRLARLIHEPPQCHREFMKDYWQNENTYVIKMGELLLCCTQEEIQRITENFSQGEYSYMAFLFDWMSDSITFVSNSVWHLAKRNVELVPVVYTCLVVLIRNFLYALLKKAAVADGEFDYIKYVNRVIIVVKKFPENGSNIGQFNILKFLVEEVPKLNKLSQNFEDNVRNLLTGLIVL